jgi:outer membrane protein OmpA-like peptidoglycan-associated protein
MQTNKEIAMKVKSLLFCLILSVLFITQTALPQYKDLGFEVGIYGAASLYNSEKLSDAKLQPGFRACVAYPLTDRFQGELGYNLIRLKAKDYKSETFPIDLRLKFSLLKREKAIPYLYAGIGCLYYNVKEYPASVDQNFDNKTWIGYVPFGAGVQYRLDDNISFDLHGGYNNTFTDDLNPIDDNEQDGFFSLLAGFRVNMGTGNKDTDGDGLDNKTEKKLGTNPKNPDTDGDGLKDGDEVKTYLTNPLKADTDGDGLTDGDEVLKYKTNPLKTDTDGDGLSDGDEVLTYKTDPLKTDTDGDGLTDGDEVLKYKTDPLKVDTDGDKLSDGDEVDKYKTDPLKMDTDGGTVDDGTEVSRGSNPLVAADDVPKIAITEVGKKIILEGIVFKTNSAEIMPESETILTDAYTTLRDNPQIFVEIRGYTDNTGKLDKNMKLSQARADAVKDWLVKKGIDGTRMTTKGFGPNDPVAPNDTPANKQKNRRIEFTRTK